MPSDRLRPHFAVLLALAFLLVAAWLLTQFWASAATGFSDPDDAMRLAQVREFLAGKGWFDLAEPRLNPPDGYLTHWSRLIDAGLAGPFLLARVFAGPEMAERVMIELWPVLWLVPAMGGVCALAWRSGGRDAALVALMLATLGLPAFQHFQPGRIDHHNVQITLAILTVAAAAWSDRLRWAAVAAGLLSALAFAIGLESLPWIVLAGAAIALRFVFDRDGAAALRAYGVALATGTLAAFFTDVAPAHWFVSVCDALAFNLALPIVVAGAMLAALSTMGARASRNMRAAGVLFCAAVALGIFASIEPRCLRGPFAMVDPAIRPIWLAYVEEMKSLVEIFREMPVTGAWVSAFPAAALIATLCLLRTPLRRDFGLLSAAGALIVSAVLTLAMVKTYSYAMWFGMPLVATGAAYLFTRLRLGLPARFIGATLLTPIVISAVAISLAHVGSVMQPAPPKRLGCFKTEAYAPLAGLPKGLIVADVDLGSTLLLLTNHAVLAAPYHRLSSSILISHRILSAPPDEAHALLEKIRATYVVLCGAAKPIGLEDAAATGGLWAKLAAGDVPAWLSRVPMPEGSAFIVYRIGT